MAVPGNPEIEVFVTPEMMIAGAVGAFEPWAARAPGHLPLRVAANVNRELNRIGHSYFMHSIANIEREITNLLGNPYSDETTIRDR